MVESRTMLFEDRVEEGDERCFPAWMRRRELGASEVRTDRRVVRCWTVRVGETSREIIWEGLVSACCILGKKREIALPRRRSSLRILGSWETMGLETSIGTPKAIVIRAPRCPY